MARGVKRKNIGNQELRQRACEAFQRNIDDRARKGQAMRLCKLGRRLTKARLYGRPVL